MLKSIYRDTLRPLLKRWLRRMPLLHQALNKLRRPPAEEPIQYLYPLDLPRLTVEPDLDFLLLELPPRYMPMMPNGLGHVHNILAKCGIRHQTLDLNIIIYHRFHSARILGGRQETILAGGYRLPEDPWDNTNIADWDKDEVLDYFWPHLEPTLQDVVDRRPKALGLSLHGLNRRLVGRVVAYFRRHLPEMVIVVGGYDCVYHGVALYLVKDYDYMVVGEAEMSLPGLARALAGGQRPRDLPGIVSRFDSPGHVWTPAPLLQDLDLVDFPTYQWADTVLYQSYTRHHLIPILVGRGCHWGRCRFCAECLPFRQRSPRKVADEMEFWVSRGFHTFHFNDSDVNGDPDNLHALCDEIIRRGLKVNLIGQLRINKRNTREYLEHLAKAGFKYLRFGVDGWNDHALQLQRKGYNMKLVFENLSASQGLGITTCVNLVLGVPGETESDVDEMIANLLKCRDYINLVESLNTLILAAGAEYYLDPDQYKIRFRGDKEKIYLEHPYFIPTDLWYSEDPFIDQGVRLKRLDRIVEALLANDIKVGGFASKTVDNLKRGISQRKTRLD